MPANRQKTVDEITIELDQARQRIAQLEALEAERQQALDKLNILNRAMLAARNGVTIVDANQPDEPIIYCNPAFERITGYRAHEVLGRNCRFLQGPDTDQTAVARIRQALKQAKECRVVLKNYRKDGTPFWNELTISPVRDRAGRLTHFIGIQNDITERRATEEQLRQNEERFRQVVSSISDHIYVTKVGNDGKPINLYISPHAERLTGYSLEQLEANWDLWAEKIIHPDDRSMAADQAAQLMRGISREVEYRLIRADGKIIWVRDSGRVVRDQESTIIYGVVSDITERKRAEEQQRQTQKMEAIGQLAGGIAHDFNNILTIISGECELILSDQMPIDEAVRQEVEYIQEASQRATHLTQQLLTFSRKQSPQTNVFNLNQVVKSIKLMLHRVIGEDVDIQTRLDPNLANIKADASQIEQVLLNLAVNGRDAMPNGGSLTIETAMVSLPSDQTHALDLHLQPGNYATLRVSDTGMGMDAATQARIFEPFFTTKPVGKGTGLGLSTVYGIVQHHKGHITIDSSPGQGTTFTIYLPASTQPALDQKKAKSEVAVKPKQQVDIVLLVEDEINVRMITRKFLQKQGYTVLEAGNLEEALTQCELQKTPIDLLITDVIMPNITGYELADTLKQWYPALKVLYISGYTDEIFSEHNTRPQDLILLEKPFSSEALASKLREVANI